MNLVRTVLSLTFDSPTKPWLEIREIIRVAAGDAQQEIQGSPLIIDRAAVKKRIVFQVRAIIHEDEFHHSFLQAKEEAVKVLVGINNASALPAVSRMRLQTVSLEPLETPFHELVASLKRKFLTPTRIGSVASDLAIVLDQNETTVKKTIHIGPMDQDQLKNEILRWPEKNLPATCIHVGLHYEQIKTIPFSRSALESFLDDATSWQTSEAVALALELKEI
jgi:hypothetical protein